MCGFGGPGRVVESRHAAIQYGDVRLLGRSWREGRSALPGEWSVMAGPRRSSSVGDVVVVGAGGGSDVVEA